MVDDGIEERRLSTMQADDARAKGPFLYTPGHSQLSVFDLRQLRRSESTAQSGRQGASNSREWIAPDVRQVQCLVLRQITATRHGDWLWWPDGSEAANQQWLSVTQCTRHTWIQRP